MNLHDVKDDVKKKVSAKPKTMEKSLKKKLITGALVAFVAVGSMAAMPEKADAMYGPSKEINLEWGWKDSYFDVENADAAIRYLNRNGTINKWTGRGVGAGTAVMSGGSSYVAKSAVLKGGTAFVGGLGGEFLFERTSDRDTGMAAIINEAKRSGHGFIVKSFCGKIRYVRIQY